MTEPHRAMTINGLLDNFRQSLLAVIPHLDAVRVPWREPDAYDEWDAISEALFDGLVLEVIRWATASTEGELPSFPRYGLSEEDYSRLSVIEVLHHNQGTASPHLVFVSFTSSKRPLDTMFCLPIGGAATAENGITLPYHGSHFRVWVREDATLRGPIDEVALDA